MRAARGTAVTIEYELRPQGAEQPVDWTDPGAPLTFLFGAGRVLPGVERLLLGLEPGDEVEGEIAPEDAYGYPDAALIESVPRDRFGSGGPPEIGAHFEARQDGRVRFAKVVGYDGDDVRLDLNHPLAGVALLCRVRVLAVRAATPVELVTGRLVDGFDAQPGPTAAR
ncbi:MAG: peptidylprolyl isomerase [Planctomycetes bacterium]|nr:peptidylprolyl isomerase [Planctomycetota bacterium]